MVFLKMSIEIHLIHQIEKHQCLYNFTLPEYNRKDVTEEAWINIAANTNLSVSDCKEKWRNIRSSFLRSMKPSGSKLKKPYYLAEYLKFIIPFLKPISLVDSTEDSTQSEVQNYSNSSEAELVLDAIKLEVGEFEENEQDQIPNEKAKTRDPLKTIVPITRRKRRFIPLIKRNSAELIRNRHRTSNFQRFDDDLSRNSMQTESNSMRMFFMSLLPEFETMTEEQKRLFKIKTMVLVDDIKTNYNQLRQNSNWNNSERLQKRLINLLLKNLQRTM